MLQEQLLVFCRVVRFVVSRELLRVRLSCFVRQRGWKGLLKMLMNQFFPYSRFSLGCFPQEGVECLIKGELCLNYIISPYRTSIRASRKLVSNVIALMRRIVHRAYNSEGVHLNM
jgi:hypothetical protein